MKKNYIAPCTELVRTHMEGHILAASGNDNIGLSDSEIDAGGAYSSRKEFMWDEE